MKTRLAVSVISIGLGTLLGTTEPASAGGLDVVGKAPPCTEFITGTFTRTSDAYKVEGTCTSGGSLGSKITFPWKAAGAYSEVDHTAREVITVDPAPISQPSHPYGRWEGIYRCPGDPWLVWFNPSTGRPTCNAVALSGDSPVKDQDLQAYFNALREYSPATADNLTQAQRDALLAKKDSDLKAIAKAEAEQRRGAAVRQSTPDQMVVVVPGPPIILAPKSGQQFYARLPVQIRLAPPQGASVTAYAISLEMRDANNHWTPMYPNLGIDAAEAQSAAGFTRFGSDGGGNTVGALPSRVGTWRVSAQVALPKPSRWSEPVVFSILQPRVSAPAGIK